MNDAAPTAMTIGSLAGELEHVALNILGRIESFGDALGGSNPSPTGESTPKPNDLHSTLQRTLTVLHNSQEQILRCEQLIGVANPFTDRLEAQKLPTTGAAMPKTLHRY